MLFWLIFIFCSWTAFWTTEPLYLLAISILVKSLSATYDSAIDELSHHPAVFNVTIGATEFANQVAPVHLQQWPVKFSGLIRKRSKMYSATCRRIFANLFFPIGWLESSRRKIRSLYLRLTIFSNAKYSSNDATCFRQKITIEDGLFGPVCLARINVTTQIPLIFIKLLFNMLCLFRIHFDFTQISIKLFFCKHLYNIIVKSHWYAVINS